MNAMPAKTLTCDSGTCPPLAETDRHGDAEIRPLRALRPAVPNPPAPRRRDTPATPRPRDTPATARRRDTPAAAPLRLTRRGRVVVAVAAALLATAVSLLTAEAVQATNHAPAAHPARQSLVQVVVRPGQNLWSVAESADPDQDTRAVVQQIAELNGLSSDVVSAGQQLWVPRG